MLLPESSRQALSLYARSEQCDGREPAADARPGWSTVRRSDGIAERACVRRRAVPVRPSVTDSLAAACIQPTCSPTEAVHNPYHISTSIPECVESYQTAEASG